MAKNGLLSEFRQDQGDDLPFVMSEVSEIKHLLPALPTFHNSEQRREPSWLEDIPVADTGIVVRVALANVWTEDLRR